MFLCVLADYVILHATEPVAQNPVCRVINPAQQDHALFEERHLRYISPLGKVSGKQHTMSTQSKLGIDINFYILKIPEVLFKQPVNKCCHLWFTIDN